MKRTYSVQQTDDGCRILNRVALPIDLADRLDRESQEHIERERFEAELRATKSDAEQKVTRSKSSESRSTWLEPFYDESSPILKVLSRADIESDLNAMEARSQDEDAKRRKSALYKIIAARGEYRKLSQIPLDWRNELGQIEAFFPNFAEVIDYLRAMFIVVDAGDKVARLDPMLFNGPPGVGKSLFSERLSKFFGSGFRRISMENVQTNAQLAGSDEFWSNSKTGAIFETLIEKDFANPVLYLDEVDKVTGRIEYDPLGALYGLLEPATAASFRDQSMPGILLNASRIIWILTCNEPSRLPDPILSRVRRFDVPSPTQEQAKNILHTIFMQVKSELKLETSVEPLSEDVIDPLGSVSPRRQKQLLREALGRALYSGRNSILRSDLRIPEDVSTNSRRIGFY